jgi:hypothetical protein
LEFCQFSRFRFREAGLMLLATVWQAALCLLLYTVTLVIRGYVAAAQARPPVALSSEQRFADVQRR